jgi:hypothetical protein
MKINTAQMIIILLLFFVPSLAQNNSYECIGFGETCTVAAALQAFNLRNSAYPFDWTISHYESLCEILENDFHGFLNQDYLRLREDGHGVINKYGLIFVHDFPTITYSGNVETEDTVGEGELCSNWIDFLPEIEKKYARRIQRLRDVCNSNKKVYFVRHMGIRSKEEACILRDIIKKHYPHLDFILVIASNDSSFDNPWEEENIKNYYLKPTEKWNDIAEWKKIFVDLGLVSAKRNMDFNFDESEKIFHVH